jgi:outer membrane protein OmpA-like peptidoglycan-associated protein/Tol biopolymer transport system component
MNFLPYSLRTALFTMAGAVLISSCATLHMDEGTVAYEQLRYQDAIHHLGKAVQGNATPEAYRMLAAAYAKVNATDEAAMAYGLLCAGPHAEDDDRIAYARILMSQGKYDRASEILDAVSARNPADMMARSLQISAMGAEDIRRDSTAYELTAMETPGVLAAFSPCVYGDQLIFTGSIEKMGARDPYTDLSYTDLYSMPISGGKPTPLEGANGPYHDGVATVSPDGKMLVYTRSSHKEEKARRLTSEGDVNNTTIYYARRNAQDTGWEKPIEIGLTDGKFMFAHPAFSADGERLYFSSNYPGGSGGMDIWYIKRNGNTWQFPPVNLGPVVNSPGNEVFPQPQGNDTLYYASDAHFTLGGLDVVYAIKGDSTWSAPHHLGYPLNSRSDDFGIVFAKGNRSGWVSSDRGGYDQIFAFTINPSPLDVRGRVVEAHSRQPIPYAKLRLIDVQDGSAFNITADKDGHFEARLPHAHKYEIQASMDLFFSNEQAFLTPADPIMREMDLVIDLLPVDDLTMSEFVSELSAGDVFQLPEINWDYDSYSLRKSSMPTLDIVAEFLANNPNIVVELQSHCDSRGQNVYNQRLSDRRARSAARYLTDRGVSSDQVVPIGKGESQLKNECANRVPCSEAKHEQNRRTEFVIVNVE